MFSNYFFLHGFLIFRVVDTGFAIFSPFCSMCFSNLFIAAFVIQLPTWIFQREDYVIVGHIFVCQKYHRVMQ